jgi:hypothetical protein
MTVQDLFNAIFNAGLVIMLLTLITSFGGAGGHESLSAGQAG